jgi:uncharacterized membrane protein YbhN (UPF0104 family)
VQKPKFPTFLLKFLISVGLIGFFVWRIDFSNVYAAILKTKVSYLLIGLVLYPLGQVICAIKWQYLARALGIHKDLKPMVGLYFIGMFFNLFLPTSIGGDITRSLYLNPRSGNTRSSFLSVLVERGTGVLSMLILASVVMLSRYGATLPTILRYGFPVASVFVFVFIWILPYALRNTRTKIRRLLFQELIVFWKHPRIGIVAVLYSVIFHSILVAIHVCIARALSLNIPVPYHFITVSLASLASLLPSFNGIGVRDGAYIYLLSRIGIDKGFGLLFSFLWFLIMAVSSFIGCIVYLIQGLSPAPGTTQIAEQEKYYAKG